MIVVLPPALAGEGLDRLRALFEHAGWSAASSVGEEQTVFVVDGPASAGDVEALLPPEIDADVVPILSREAYARIRRRRRLLTGLAVGLALLVVFAVVVPVVGYLEPPEGSFEAPVARVGDLRANAAKRIQVGGEPALLVRDGAELRALSATCTFAGGCLLEWDAVRRALVCPLHDIAYDLFGQPVHGPASEPLRVFPVRRVDDRIYVEARP
jgi:nitrite reductase/ring-hydroxylating ferredoxin subunit